MTRPDFIPTHDDLGRPFSVEDWRKLAFVVTVLQNKWIKRKPTAAQERALQLDHIKEVFYGGAAGGGKSLWLLMEALKYVDEPGYSALLLRKTFTQLAQENAIMNTAMKWLTPHVSSGEVHWSSQDHRFTFPSSATLSFGFLEREEDIYRYDGSEYHMVGFDETSQFSESQYTYLFSRLRKTKEFRVPLRMRAASNPGNIGHEWLKNRFIVGDLPPDRVFIPARIADNPHLDADDYIKGLHQLGEVRRRQLLDGDWDACAGDMFKREWFEIVDVLPPELHRVRYWDIAATKPHEGNKDPDWTVGVLMGVDKSGTYYVIDVKRIRDEPNVVEALIYQTAQADGHGIPIVMEEEPAAAGKMQILYYRKKVLQGFSFYSDREVIHKARSKGEKELRAQPLASQSYAPPGRTGNIKVKRGSWNQDMFAEMETFPHGAHDDIVDACSQAFQYLTKRSGNFITADPIPNRHITSPDLTRRYDGTGAVRRNFFGLGDPRGRSRTEDN